jgi:hypothetical protein
VAAVQDVEHAVGEHDRPRQRGDPRSEIASRAELVEKGRGDDHPGIVACAAGASIPDGLDSPHTESLRRPVMLVLCGFAISNYYNKVKLALLEKGVEFTEEIVPSGKKSDAVLQASPLGKVPFIRTEHGAFVRKHRRSWTTSRRAIRTRRWCRRRLGSGQGARADHVHRSAIELVVRELTARRSSAARSAKATRNGCASC